MSKVTNRVKQRRAAGMTDDEICIDLAEEVELGNSEILKQIEVNSGLRKENGRLLGALDKIKIEILGGDCVFVELSRVKRIAQIVAAIREETS